MNPIDVELAQLSELFMLLAAFVYTVAFLAFAWDIAQSSVTLKKLDRELAAQRSATTAQASSAAVAQNSQSSATGTTVLAPAPAAEEPAAAREDYVDDELSYTGMRRPIANVAVGLTVFAFLFHLAAVISRGVAAHRVPWGNMYEFATTGALLVALVYLVVLTRKDIRFLGSVVLALIVLAMCGATMGFPTPVAHLQPVLRSYWLVIHVSVAVLAVALLTISFAMSVLQLIQARAEKRAAQGGRGWSYLRFVPSAGALENWAYRFNAFGFTLWTFTLIAGAIWAQAAWGRYWNWDTKEVWTFVIWVLYAGYLHARATKGWTGARAAWLSIVGYAAVIFNFAVVNIYFPGLHSYAGVPGSN